MDNYRVEHPSLRTGLHGRSILDRVFDWIPVVILAYPILLSPFIIQFTNNGGSDNNIAASKSNLLNQLFWIGLFGLTLISAGRRLLQMERFLKSPVFWMTMLYLGLALASVTWSPVPGIAFRRLVLQAIIVLCLVFSISCSDDIRALFNRLVTLMSVVVLMNAAAVVVLPPTPLGYAGLYPQKNGLGAVMAIAFLFCLYGLMISRGWKRLGMVIVLTLAFGLLLLSQSKTSLGLAVLLPVLAYLLVGTAYLLRINAAFLLLFGLAFAVVLWSFFSSVTRFDFTDLSLLLFHDETYTGRTVIWAFVLDVISRAPFFGQGYSSFWAIGSDSIVFREAPGFVVSLLQAHNGYLDVLVETGAAGLSLLLLLILAACFTVARTVPQERQIAFLCYSLILFAVSHNMLESSWFRGFSMNWLIFLLAGLVPAAALARRK